MCFDNSQEQDFCDTLINLVRKLRENEIVVVEGDLNGHVESDPYNYDDQHGGYSYGV